jgi:hypothetical protein
MVIDDELKTDVVWNFVVQIAYDLIVLLVGIDDVAVVVVVVVVLVAMDNRMNDVLIGHDSFEVDFPSMLGDDIVLYLDVMSNKNIPFSIYLCDMCK